MDVTVPRILVVDDEPPIVDLVTGYLEREGWTVTSVGDGIAAIEAVRADDPDVVILDVMLPGVDGVEACRQIRGFSNAYIVMLTARGEEIDRIMGLTVGADDYLVKPFSPRELVARIKALLRRQRDRTDASDRATGGLDLDEGRRTVRVDGQPVDLTALEFNLLATLARRSRDRRRTQGAARPTVGARVLGGRSPRRRPRGQPATQARRRPGASPVRRDGAGRGVPAPRGHVKLPRSLRARLLAAFLVVVVAALGTVGVAVLLVGPGYFAEAMGHMPGDPLGEAMADATQAAFADAMRQALLAATVIAVVTATIVSLAVAARIARPMTTLAHAARRDRRRALRREGARRRARGDR